MRSTPARLALLASVPVSLALATGASPIIYAPLIVLAGMSYGALFTPSFSLVSEGAEGAGLAQGMAFGLMNAAWATGAMVGPAAAGLIAGATGDAIPFVLAAACPLAALAFLRASLATRGPVRSQPRRSRPQRANASARGLAEQQRVEGAKAVAIVEAQRGGVRVGDADAHLPRPGR